MGLGAKMRIYPRYGRLEVSEKETHGSLHPHPHTHMSIEHTLDMYKSCTMFIRYVCFMKTKTKEERTRKKHSSQRTPFFYYQFHSASKFSQRFSGVFFSFFFLLSLDAAPLRQPITGKLFVCSTNKQIKSNVVDIFLFFSTLQLYMYTCIARFHIRAKR